MASEEWSDPEHVAGYLDGADDFPHRAEGEGVLFDHLLPREPGRVLDLGTGDGRLIRMLRARRPGIEAVGVDSSPLMLEEARRAFEGADGVEIRDHDLSAPLPPDLGRFDAVVSSFAIHHLPDARKRELYAEVLAVLEPGGLFANLEHVASPTERLHEAFFAAIGEPLSNEDPSDRTVDAWVQAGWLREAGYEDADCYWKWLEMALLIGIRPGEPG